MKKGSVNYAIAKFGLVLMEQHKTMLILQPIIPMNQEKKYV